METYGAGAGSGKHVYAEVSYQFSLLAANGEANR